MECYNFSIDRAPNWKWLRMLGIDSNDQPKATKLFDTQDGSVWINRALDFYRSYKKETNPLLNNDLILQYGDIYTARKFYTDTESLFRWELEASVLANVEGAEIALNIGCPESAIKAYEELFFDVRCRLDCPAYIRNYIIGESIQNIQPNDYDKLWKHYAYDGGGYEMLKTLIKRTTNVPRSISADMVDSTLDSDISSSIRIAAATAAKSPPALYQASGRIIDAALKLREIEKLSELSSGGASGDILKHLDVMFSQLPWRVGGVDPDTKIADKRTNPVSRYMSTRVELTYAETVDASIVGETPEAEKVIDLKYPPLKVKKA